MFEWIFIQAFVLVLYTKIFLTIFRALFQNKKWKNPQDIRSDDRLLYITIQNENGLSYLPTVKNTRYSASKVLVLWLGGRLV